MPSPVNPYKQEEMKQYFASLPPFVQETLMQCNPGIQSIEELRTCAEKLLQP